MRHRALLLLLLVGLFMHPVHACAATDLKAVVAVLEKGYAALTDVQAEFVQRTMIASVKREEKGSGELFIKKPAKGAPMFRFNYVKPRQQIVSNGKTVWFYLPENKQVLIGDATTVLSGGGGGALSYLAGMERISQDFTIAFAGDGRDKKGNYVLELVPKKPDQLVEKLLLTVSGTAVESFVERGSAEQLFPLVSLVAFDNYGNRTAMEFAKVKTNRGIPAERFAFKIPAGVEVIRNK